MALHALLTVLLAPCVLASSKSVPRAELDLFVLVREYSPTFCSKEVCTIKPISAFTIHGLWPEYNNGAWPEFCSDSGNSSTSSSGGSAEDNTRRLLSLPDTAASRTTADTLPHERHSLVGAQRGGKAQEGDDAQVQAAALQEAGAAVEHGGGLQERQGSTEARQQCEWPSFKGTNLGFWEHEWSRHGTCARTITGLRPDYFEAVLKLHESYDLDAALAVAGIAPSDAALYSTRKVSQAVEDAFGVLPLLSCHNGDLLELWLCIGLDLKVQQCPPGVVKSQRRSCGKTVRLPEGEPVSAECRSYFPPWDASNTTGGSHLFARIATGLAVAGVGLAAAALFWSGARGRQQRLLSRIPEERYDPLQSWP
ncbi:hypothetical protein D9Q98_004538 [Chlorella vulgaris]|uniref:Uncharacterized protein n=1 Tax=Chlorella vulgaris TaxID=3077 RepID=A0A9D4TPT8_CHLVU|nr:hypothetical protein D9Q98_004538 [Chlorella vulgaris]